MNEQLKEKIARIIYTVRLNIMHGFYVNDMEIAQQILDLPMPDLNCTVGEALEKVGEMVEVLKTVSQRWEKDGEEMKEHKYTPYRPKWCNHPPFMGISYCWGLAISVKEGKLEEFLREKCKDCDFSKFYEKEKK